MVINISSFYESFFLNILSRLWLIVFFIFSSLELIKSKSVLENNKKSFYCLWKNMANISCFSKSLMVPSIYFILLSTISILNLGLNLTNLKSFSVIEYSFFGLLVFIPSFREILYKSGQFTYNSFASLLIQNLCILISIFSVMKSIILALTSNFFIEEKSFPSI